MDEEQEKALRESGLRRYAEGMDESELLAKTVAEEAAAECDAAAQRISTYLEAARIQAERVSLQFQQWADHAREASEEGQGHVDGIKLDFALQVEAVDWERRGRETAAHREHQRLASAARRQAFVDYRFYRICWRVVEAAMRHISEQSGYVSPSEVYLRHRPALLKRATGIEGETTEAVSEDYENPTETLPLLGEAVSEFMAAVRSEGVEKFVAKKLAE